MAFWAVADDVEGPIGGETVSYKVTTLSLALRASSRQRERKVVGRMTGVEPAFKAWEAFVLPMNYIRKVCLLGTSH